MAVDGSTDQGPRLTVTPRQDDGERRTQCIDESGQRLRALYAQHYPQIQRYARRFADHALAEDISQEVFLRLMVYKSAALDEISLAFLLTMTRNVALKMLAQRQREHGPEATPETGEASQMSSHLPKDDEQRWLSERFDRLPERQRDVLLLTEACGLSEEQAARALHVSRSAISQRRRVALGYLRGAGRSGLTTVESSRAIEAMRSA